ncbi:MAG: NAD-dependent epimerase/dehydratase family protein [Alphaproteobacteria bacterium]
MSPDLATGASPGRPASPRLAADARRAAFAGRRCVVTGGLGFIGSNLALELARAGASVRVVDAMVPGHGGNPRNLDGASGSIEVLIANVGDDERVAPALSDADFVFNLAGQISHLDSMEDPLTDFDLNARSHLSLLETLRRLGSTAVIVYTSTRQIYGRPRRLPVDETHPVDPVDVNGISQHAAEQLHLLYARVYGMRACSLRLTNVYGPRLRLADSRQGVLGVFLRLALDDETLRLYGEGSQLRDFLHVDDVVDALLAAALEPAAVGEAFNVSHDEVLSLHAAASAIVTAAGSGRVELVPWPRDREAIDIGDFVGDSTKARRVLGWAPRVAFADGIRETVAFYRERRAWYL